MLPVARRDKLLTESIGNELLVYDRKVDRARTLTPTNALVWRNCDGNTSVAQLTEILAKELGAPADEEIVWQALEELERARLLEHSVEEQSFSAHGRRGVRSSTLGIPRALALLASLFQSITAPMPAPEVNVQSGNNAVHTGGKAGVPHSSQAV
jgi:hypothetical protein